MYYNIYIYIYMSARDDSMRRGAHSLVVLLHEIGGHRIHQRPHVLYYNIIMRKRYSLYIVKIYFIVHYNLQYIQYCLSRRLRFH